MSQSQSSIDAIASLSDSLLRVSSSDMAHPRKKELVDGITAMIKSHLPEMPKLVKPEVAEAEADKKVYIHFHGEKATGKSRLAMVVSMALQSQGFKTQVGTAGRDSDVVTVENPLYREGRSDSVTADAPVSEQSDKLKAYAKILGEALNINPASIVFYGTPCNKK